MSQSTLTPGDINKMMRHVGVIFIIVVLSTTIVKFQEACALEKVTRKKIYNNNGLGTYSFEYAISDGSYRKEDGGIITNAAGAKGLVVRGEYGYTDPDGQLHSIRYVADSDGYRPQNIVTDIRFNDRRIV